MNHVPAIDWSGLTLAAIIAGIVAVVFFIIAASD